MGTNARSGIIDLERGPRIVCIPSTDPEMREVVKHLYTSIPWVTPDKLQAALCDRYPGAVVRRVLLSSEPFPTWYVFKEIVRPERTRA